jgi:CubicO group peptidase (beta-lactamase class C family)
MRRLAIVAAVTALALTGVVTAASAAGPPVPPNLGLKSPTQPPPPPPPPPPPAAPGGVTTQETIDLDKFASGIFGRLNGNVVGFSYAIARNGAVVRSGAGGFRRLDHDGGADAFTADTMTQAASTSKTITAAALAKALHERGLSVDSQIGKYLPRCWKKGPSVNSFTFRDVLGHHTMLPDAQGCADDPLLCILEMIAKGTPARRKQDVEPYRYSNSVYGLVRVLVPFVLSRVEMQLKFGLAKPRCRKRTEQHNKLVSDRFREYVFEKVLAPAGAVASFFPQGDGVEDWAYVYNKANLAQPGVAPREDFHLRAGAGYLAIGARSYARFLSALDAGLIVPKSLAEEMKGVPNNRMGFDKAIGGELGDYVWKNGGCPSAEGTKPGCSALAVVFPNGMQAFVAINSSNNTYKPLHGGLDKIVRDAFDEALL